MLLAAITNGAPQAEAAEAASLRNELLSAIGRPKPLTTGPSSGQPHDTDDLRWERWRVVSEPLPLGGVPVLSAKPLRLRQGARLPAIVVMHGTGGRKEDMQEYLAHFARLGTFAVSFDMRYHGERGGIADYHRALIAAWRARGANERPFIFDMAWDCIAVVDAIAGRDDVDASRIGVTGKSLGGMVAWIAAAADERIAAAAPAIGVQGFRYAVDTGSWQARVDSIRPLFAAAAADMGKEEIDGVVVRAVWEAITPGLLDRFDAPSSLRLIAPRPLLVVNGLLDPRCPAEGVRQAVHAASGRWGPSPGTAGLELILEEGVGHEITPVMWSHITAFLVKHLRASQDAALGTTWSSEL